VIYVYYFDKVCICISFDDIYNNKEIVSIANIDPELKKKWIVICLCQN